MISQIYQDVKNKYQERQERLIHIFGVVETAIKLAKHYNYDIKKAEIAALFHDYTKYDDLETQLKYVTQAEKDKYIEFDVMFHAISAARILKEKYNINDQEILDAIYYHVWGRTNMTLLDKIILLADKTEPSRKYKTVDKLRELSYISLDLAIIEYSKDYIKREQSLNRKYPLIVDEILEELKGDKRL